MNLRQTYAFGVITAGIVIALSAGPVHGQSKVGTTAGTFLTIPVGPRATAMGGAFVSIADDATALFWNAGGLSRLPQNEILATHARWLAGTNLNWAGVAIKIDDANAVGLSVNQLDYGEDEITTPDNPNGTGQMWDAQDVAIGLSYARNLTDRFSVGGTAKYVRERIWNESADALAFDVGLLFITDFHDVRLGMSITSFGTEMQLAGKDLYQPVDVDPGHAGNNASIVSSLGTKSWTLPLMFAVGVGGTVFRGEDFVWTLAADATYPSSQSPYLNAGTEFTWDNLVALRVGQTSLFKDDAEQGFTAGLGIRYALGPLVTAFDYSYTSFGRFDGVSRFGLAIGF